MDTLTLWLAGDVMTGRGIDQIQAHPVAPLLYESWVRDARDYVRLAERVNGPVPAPVAPDYIWGDALAEIERRQPELRLSIWKPQSPPRMRPGPTRAFTTACIPPTSAA